MISLLRRILKQFNISVSRYHVLGYKHDIHVYKNRSRPAIPEFLNIGSGDFFHPVWHNLDLPSEWYSKAQKSGLHIAHDLMSGKPLPLKDDSLSVAYTSHTIEHLRDQDVALMFAEVYRVLRPGGYFRITCPDIELYYRAYHNKDSYFFIPYKEKSLEQCFLRSFATQFIESHTDRTVEKYSDAQISKMVKEMPMEDFLNHFTTKINVDVQKKNPGNHMNWYTAEKVTRMLQKAGFTNVYRSGYNQSQSVYLRNQFLFDNHIPGYSLYMECRK